MRARVRVCVSVSMYVCVFARACVYVCVCVCIIYIRGLNKEFRNKMKLAKLECKNKVEQKLLSGNASDVWKGLNRMMGRTRKEQPLVPDNLATFANDLSRFYARYDNIDYRDEFDILCHAISSSPETLVESDVV